MKFLKLLSIVCAICAYSMSVSGQTYSVSGSGQCASPSTIEVGTAGMTVYRGAISLSASVSGNNVTFTVASCMPGGEFSAGTTFHLKESTSRDIATVAGQSTDLSTVTVVGSSGTIKFSHSLPFTAGTRHYVVVYTDGSMFGCTEVVSISADGNTGGGAQTWKLSDTMTATLDSDGVLTISTTKAEGEAMPNYDNLREAPWDNVRETILSVVIENKVTTVGTMTFASCENLSNVTISNSVYAIEFAAFNGCSSLVTASIPNSITRIGDFAFTYSALTSLTIPNSIEVIGEGVFYGCSNIPSVSIPRTTITIGNQAFGKCASLTSIQVDSQNQDFSSENGILYNKNKSYLHSYPAGKSGSFTIPASVITIGEAAFNQNALLTSVDIPSSVKTILHNAFYDCSNLSTIRIPSSVTSIGNYAFIRTGLNAITVEWLTPISIPDNIFYEINISAATLHVPSGTKSLYAADPVWGQFGTIVEGSGGGGPAGDPPTCVLKGVTDLTANSATLNGTVNPNGVRTSYMFQYSTNSNFPQNSTTFSTPIEIIGSGTSAVPVSAEIKDLYSARTYYYRIVALNDNKGDTTTDPDIFTTPYDIRLNAAMNIPANMTSGQSYTISIEVFNNSSEHFTGSFYLKDGENEVPWNERTIDPLKPYTLEGKPYTPSSSGTKTLTLFHQAGNKGSGTMVDQGNYKNPITVTVSSPTYHTVSFNANGGSPTPPSQSVISGGKVSQPATPSRTGYKFDGWYNGSTVWNFNNPVNANMTLTAHWTQEQTVTPTLSVTPPTSQVNPAVLNGEANANAKFDVTSNIANWTSNWTVEVTNSVASWLSVTKNPNNTSFAVNTRSANNTGNPRGATVVVSTGDLSETVYILQETIEAGTTPTEPSLKVSVNNTSLLPATESTREITITSNVSWKVVSQDDWLKVPSDLPSGSGNGNRVFTVTAERNSNSGSRTGKLTITGTGVSPVTLNIGQSGAGAASALTVSIDNSSQLPASGGTREIKITSNVNWTVSSGENWLTVPAEAKSGNGDYTFKITIPGHDKTSSRSARLTITGAGVNPPRTIDISQAAAASKTGTLSGYIRDVNNKPIETVTLTLSPSGQIVLVSNGQFNIQGIPYGTSGTINVSKIGYDKFVDKETNSTTIRYSITDKEPNVSRFIVGTPANTTATPSQTNDFELTSAISLTKSPFQAEVPAPFNVNVRNVSGKRWTGRFYFVDVQGGIDFPGSSISREHEATDEMTFEPNESRNIAFSFSKGFSGDNTRFAIISRIKENGYYSNKYKYVGENGFENPVTLKIQPNPTKDRENAISKANQNFKDLIDALEYGNYVLEAGLLIFEAGQSEAIWKGGSDHVTAQLLQGHIEELKKYSSKLEKLQEYAGNIKTVLDAINDIDKALKNSKTPAGWLEIAKIANKRFTTPFATIFNTYLEVGATAVNNLTKLLNDNWGSLMFNGNVNDGITVKIKVNNYNSSLVVNQIKQVDFYFCTFGTNMKPQSFNDFTHCENIGINGNAEIFISSNQTLKIGTDSSGMIGSDDLYAWLAIYWKNGKVTWVPFNKDYISQIGGRASLNYELTFKSNSGKDNFADKLTINVN